MPKRMMFTRLQTARLAGGAKQRWKDCVQHDLRVMGLEDGWSSLAQQRDKWHLATERAISKWEGGKNAKEKEAYEQKKTGVKVKCPHCPYLAKNEHGLKLHFGHMHKFVADLSDDSDDDDDDDDDPPTSSCSSTATTAATTKSKYICSTCGKDCTSGSGLSSHLRHSKTCKPGTTADRTK